MLFLTSHIRSNVQCGQFNSVQTDRFSSKLSRAQGQQRYNELLKMARRRQRPDIFSTFEQFCLCFLDLEARTSISGIHNSVQCPNWTISMFNPPRSMFNSIQFTVKSLSELESPLESTHSLPKAEKVEVKACAPWCLLHLKGVRKIERKAPRHSRTLARDEAVVETDESSDPNSEISSTSVSTVSERFFADSSSSDDNNERC